MKAIGDCHLYGILDGDYVGRAQALDVATQMIAGGIDALQLRAKNWTVDEITALGNDLHPLTRKGEIPLIINDYPDVAVAIGAEGVHVGQDDLPVQEVRRRVGGDMLVGLSTHSLEQVRAAATQEVDYIGFGPLFSTPTKPDYPAIGTLDILRAHREHPGLPIFCIGGVKLENAASVIEAGAQRVVVVSGILQAGDIEAYTRHLKALFEIISR
jgi:thiamine-phosphate pyrophosphorylase